MDNKTKEKKLKMQIEKLEDLEGLMRVGLSRPNQSSVQNTLVSLQAEGTAAKAVKITLNKYLDLCNKLKYDEITRPVAVSEIKRLVAELEAALSAEALFNETKNSEEESSELSLGFNFNIESVKGLLETYNSNKSKLAADLLRNNKVVGYAPIIPLTKPGLDAAKLTSMGIKASRVAGYTVLEKQMVVGISMELLKKESDNFATLKEDLANLVKLGKAASKATVGNGQYLLKTTSAQMVAISILEKYPEDEAGSELLKNLRKIKIKTVDQANAALTLVRACAAMIGSKIKDVGVFSEQEMLDSLRESASKVVGKPLMAIGSVVSSVGGKWLWLAPQKEIDMMNKAAMGGHFNILKWGLAFSGT